MCDHTGEPHRHTAVSESPLYSQETGSHSHAHQEVAGWTGPLPGQPACAHLPRLTCGCGFSAARPQGTCPRVLFPCWCHRASGQPGELRNHPEQTTPPPASPPSASQPVGAGAARPWAGCFHSWAQAGLQAQPRSRWGSGYGVSGLGGSGAGERAGVRGAGSHPAGRRTLLASVLGVVAGAFVGSVAGSGEGVVKLGLCCTLSSRAGSLELSPGPCSSGGQLRAGPGSRAGWGGHCAVRGALRQ